MKKKLLIPVTVLLILAMFASQSTAFAQESTDDDICTSCPHQSYDAWFYLGTVPDSWFDTYTASYTGCVDIGLQDCCWTDDVVELYIDSVHVWTVDSRTDPPEYGTHLMQWKTFKLCEGDHTLEFKLVISGSSGGSRWYYDFSNFYPCPSAPLFSDVLTILPFGIFSGALVVRRRRRKAN